MPGRQSGGVAGRVGVGSGARGLGFVLCLALVTAGCAGPTPDGAAKDWLEATVKLDGNKAADLTCASEQGSVQMGGMALSVASIIGQNVIGQSFTVDTSGLSYVTVQESGSSAEVRISGTIRAAILGISQGQQVNETVRMALESGQWKYCGSPS